MHKVTSAAQSLREAVGTDRPNFLPASHSSRTQGPISTGWLGPFPCNLHLLLTMLRMYMRVSCSSPLPSLMVFGTSLFPLPSSTQLPQCSGRLSFVFPPSTLSGCKPQHKHLLSLFCCWENSTFPGLLRGTRGKVAFSQATATLLFCLDLAYFTA